MYPGIAVVGPTGSGKSHLALQLAHSFRGEIINCDSVQVYRELDVGAAKTPPRERAGVPHHLLDVISPDQELSAGAYARLARAVLHEVQSRGSLPLIVGGTGFYLRALLEGLSPAPLRDESLRVRLRGKSVVRPLLLHRYLRRFDPVAADRIHCNDRQKLIRAVELAMRGGQPTTVIQGNSRDALVGFKILKVGLEPTRAELYERLNCRAEAMFREGLLEETQRLLDRGVSPEAKPLQALGYKQAVQVLQSGLSLSEAIVECQTRTRQYAKRQLTWFRHDAAVHWLRGFGSDPAIASQARHLCRAHLENI